jgi:hypothetical protein
MLSSSPEVFVEEFCDLQIPNCTPEVRLRKSGHGLEELLFDVVDDDRSALEYFLELRT